MESQNLSVKPKLKIYTIDILFSLSIIFALLYFLSKVPTSGIYVLNIFDVKNQWIRNKILWLLRYHISYAAIQNLFLSLIGVVSAYIFYLWLKVKTTSLSFTNKYFEMSHGILSRKSDFIDMVDIRDQELYQSIVHRILGISRVTIISRDLSTPILNFLLDSKDGNEVINFLKLYSTKSIVDYQLTRDLKSKKNSKEE